MTVERRKNIMQVWTDSKLYILTKGTLNFGLQGDTVIFAAKSGFTIDGGRHG